MIRICLYNFKRQSSNPPQNDHKRVISCDEFSHEFCDIELGSFVKSKFL